MTDTTTVSPVPLRRPGRPKGHGGRPPGTPNRNTVATRQRIEELADPVAFLCGVVRGEPVRGHDGAMVRPTLDQRIDAAKVLLARLVPPATELLDLSPERIVVKVMDFGAACGTDDGQD